MGAVYEVEQLSTGRRRALKTMHASLASDRNSLDRFAQEARIGSAIASDHVVEVLAAGVDEPTGVPWLVMEMLEGETLGDRIARGPVSQAETLAVIEQLCHALAAAHRSGVVHRDLKPDNVFLARARRGDVPFTVKVLDFGIAKWVQELQGASANSQAMGTPMWMAPEQATPGMPIRPSTDVWALGLIAFSMLTGRSYWRSASTPGASVQSLVVEIMVEPLEPAIGRCASLGCNAFVPPGFDAWFARCVVREPERRYADASLAMQALRAALGPAATAFAAPASLPGATAPLLFASTPGSAQTPPLVTAQPVAGSASQRWVVGLVAASAMLLLGAAGVGGLLFWLARRDANSSDGTVDTPASASSNAAGGLGAKMVTAGPLHACALLPDATVHCWGNNMNGQLGDGTTQGHPIPVKVQNLSGVHSIAAGSSFTCAVLEDGVVRCWGDNQQGQLGDGTKMSRLQPETVLDLTGVIDISPGFWHTCAVVRDRSVRCWGSNDFGGLGGAPAGLRPSAVPSLQTVRLVSVNVQQSCALLISGAVTCWGALRRKPSNVPELTDAVAISVGASSACVVVRAGGVRCWGKNEAGQLGNGTSSPAANPVDVVALGDAIDVSVGSSHACALHKDGKVSCWGSNAAGQLGDGSGREQLTPVVVSSVSAVQIATAGNASYAVTSDGRVLAWGANENGQLGDGTTRGRATPGRVDIE